MESEFPSNSRVRKEAPAKVEAKQVKRVVSGDVVRRKKPAHKRMFETFIGGDARSVWAYVALDVLIPAAKDMIADAGSTFFERMLFGDSHNSRRRPSQRNNNNPLGYVAYNRYAPSSSRSRDRDDGRRDISRRSRTMHNFDEIILGTRVEAEEVIDRLFDLVSRYETATVADLYELVGVSSNFTDDSYGWTDMRGAGVTRVRNGYLLDLPKPEPLEK